MVSEPYSDTGEYDCVKSIQKAAKLNVFFKTRHSAEYYEMRLVHFTCKFFFNQIANPFKFIYYNIILTIKV
jgi:hypothetical protein